MTNLTKTGSEHTLLMNPRSPFARRIRLALNRLQFDFNERDLGNVLDPQPELWNLNPLGMIPTLVLPNGLALSGSLNLLEYLDDETRLIWPEERLLRTQVRQVSTWCEGVMQSAVLYFQELKLHEQPSPRWIAEHVQSIEDTLLYLSTLNDSMWMQNATLTQAGWDLAVALEYLDFRLPEINWRKFEGLKTVLSIASKNEFFAQTTPKH